MLRKIAISGMMLACSLNANAAQCPPGSALKHNIPNAAWQLDPAYIAQGWELSYQSPKLMNSYLKFVPPGMAVFVNLSEYNNWKARCIYYAPLDNPQEKEPLVLQTKQEFDAKNIYYPKFSFQPSTLMYTCQATAGDSFSCAWI